MIWASVVLKKRNVASKSNSSRNVIYHNHSYMEWIKEIRFKNRSTLKYIHKYIKMKIQI